MAMPCFYHELSFVFSAISMGFHSTDCHGHANFHSISHDHVQNYHCRAKALPWVSETLTPTLTLNGTAIEAHENEEQRRGFVMTVPWEFMEALNSSWQCHDQLAIQ